MSYSQDFAGSARRHLAAAKRLSNEPASGDGVGNRAVAGYLFGISGELAIKQIMVENGMRPLDLSQRHDDPFYAHFPKIRSLLRNNAKGRRQAKLIKYACNDSLFQTWSTEMRYAPTNEIVSERTELWKRQAEELVSNIGL